MKQLLPIFLAAFLLTFTGMCTNLIAQTGGSAFGNGSAFGTSNNTEDDEPDLTTIEFSETEYDFGKVSEGEMIRHTFIFTNTGENDLLIENVKPSCTCAKLEFPSELIPPGKTGEIIVHFDTAGKSGKQDKNLTVIYNGNPRFERIFFRGEVIETVQGEVKNTGEQSSKE